MARYVWKDGTFRDKRTGEEMALPYAGQIVAPRVISDLPMYISPVTRKPVEGRAARREDLKRSGCREVDPSEYKPVYRSKKMAERMGALDRWDPGAGKREMKYTGFLK